LTLSRANPNTGKNVNPTDSDRPQIANLESKVRKLNQALTYIENPEKVAELQDLVDVWRAGGREIVERLFHIVPRPEEFSSALRHGQTSSTSFQWSDDVKRPSMMTQEQRDYLAHAPTDDDGDPIDSEGNSLLPDMMSQDELMRAIESEANLGERRLGTGAYLPTSFVK